MAFVNRIITAVFDLGEGQFGTSGSTQLTLDGLRMSATVTQSGIPDLARLQADFYGMTLSQMNQLTTLGATVSTIRKNTVTIFAGDAGKKPSQIFKGTIYDAWGDFNNAPDVPFRVQAQAGLLESVAPFPSTNPKGAVAAAGILKSFAAQWDGGLPFVNDGVNTILSNPHFYGDLKNQILGVCREARCWWNGGEGGVFAVWPVSGSRSGQSIPEISSSTGLVGYPTYTSTGMIIKSVFMPDIRYGSLVKVKSSVKIPLTPNGQWQVYGVTYNLASLEPHGDWFMDLFLTPPGTVSVPPL